MSKKCLITTSLIGSIDWAQMAPGSIIRKEKGGDGVETWASKAVKDLKATLGRESYEMNEAAQRGISFENKLYAVARTGTKVVDGSDHFKRLAEEIIGGQYQRKCKMEYKVDDELCFLYGKIDVFFPGVRIIDVKTTANYKPDKYSESFQHTLYCFIEKVWLFDYFVAVWGKYPKIEALHQIKLQVDPVFAEKIIQAKIRETFNFLKKHNLWEMYRETYCLY